MSPPPDPIPEPALSSGEDAAGDPVGDPPEARVPALTLAAWAAAALAAAVSMWVVTEEPRMTSRPAPSLSLVALPYAVLAALAWWSRRSATARWVALAGVLLVFGLGAALWLAWTAEPLARLSAPRLVPGRQLVAVAVVAYVLSLAKRSGR